MKLLHQVKAATVCQLLYLIMIAQGYELTSCDHLNESLNVCYQQLENFHNNEKVHTVLKSSKSDTSAVPHDSECEDESCPAWQYCANNGDNIKSCKCGPNLNNIIRCNETEKKAEILDCNCVTLTEDGNETVTVAGPCVYNCEGNLKHKHYDLVYHLLSNNASNLIKSMCGGLHRKGPLCGQCLENYYPIAYSYNLHCVHCPDGHKNWWKYIMAAFLPLTVFYFIVLFFKINATSSHLHGFVMYSHTIAVPNLIRIILRAVQTRPTMLTAGKIALTMYGIWNLDYFRTLLPNICLHTTTLQTLALDYIIAVYPLFLMIISYILIELHDRNVKVIVFLWKPFRLIFTFFRRNWDSRTSVIDAYTTFFLLSTQKFLSVSFDLLVPATLYELETKKKYLVLYYDGSIKYFSNEHLPYGILAIVILTVFFVCPTLTLLVYQYSFFQNFLNKFPTRTQNILRTFFDAIQGCYKDGTEPGTRDYRWFPALFLLLRLALFLAYAITLGSLYFEIGIIVLTLFALLLIVLEPFKKNLAYYTKINTTCVVLVILFYTSIVGIDMSSIKGEKFFTFYSIVAAISGLFPIAYISCIVIHWMYSRRKWSVELLSRLQTLQLRSGYDYFRLDTDFEDSLPDRLYNPEHYQKLP